MSAIHTDRPHDIAGHTRREFAPSTIRTRSTHPLALIRHTPNGPVLAGYAAAQTRAVENRARRLGAHLLPIANGRIEVPAHHLIVKDA